MKTTLFLSWLYSVEIDQFLGVESHPILELESTLQVQGKICHTWGNEHRLEVLRLPSPEVQLLIFVHVKHSLQEIWWYMTISKCYGPEWEHHRKASTMFFAKQINCHGPHVIDPSVMFFQKNVTAIRDILQFHRAKLDSSNLWPTSHDILVSSWHKPRGRYVSGR
jgi:hypothetical protein